MHHPLAPKPEHLYLNSSLLEHKGPVYFRCLKNYQYFVFRVPEYSDTVRCLKASKAPVAFPGFQASSPCRQVGEGPGPFGFGVCRAFGLKAKELGTSSGLRV